MVQQQQVPDLSKATRDGRFVQLAATPPAKLETLFQDWGSEQVLTVLQELSGITSDYCRPRFSFLWLLALPPTFFILSVPWSLLFALTSCGLLVPVELQVRRVRHDLRKQIRYLLEALLPFCTEAQLPALLTLFPKLDVFLGNEHFCAALVRLLPRMSPETAATLTREHRLYLRRLLASRPEELVIATLLALGTIRNVADRHAVETRIQFTTERITEAKKDCLRALNTNPEDSRLG